MRFTRWLKTGVVAIGLLCWGWVAWQVMRFIF